LLCSWPFAADDASPFSPLRSAEVWPLLLSFEPVSGVAGDEAVGGEDGEGVDGAGGSRGGEGLLVADEVAQPARATTASPARGTKRHCRVALIALALQP
jgi:hypothetical protein